MDRLRADTKVLIVGSGIGGTAAAVALRREGLTPAVYERGPAAAAIQVGGCYVLWYGGVASLAWLGLAEKATDVGHRIDRFELCDADGQLISSIDVGGRGRELGVVPLAIRRADLLAMLADAVTPGDLTYGATFRDLTQDDRKVTATFTDGSSVDGDALVGADGLDSTVRAQLNGMEPARHPGYAHWWSITEDDCGTPPHVFRIMHGEGSRFAFFRLADGRVCWWCVRPSGPPDPGELADLGGDHQALTMSFRTWSRDVVALLAATEPTAIGRRDTMDRPAAKHWGTGRVTMLGDAAHAMTFNLGQGAGTALSDAVTLAARLGAGGPMLATLREYEATRRSVTNPLVRASARVGATAAWGFPAGPAFNRRILRVGARVTPRLLERDLHGHPHFEQ